MEGHNPSTEKGSYRNCLRPEAPSNNEYARGTATTYKMFGKET